MQVLFSMGNISLMFLFSMGNVGLMFISGTSPCKESSCSSFPVNWWPACSISCKWGQNRPGVLHARQPHVHPLRRRRIISMCTWSRGTNEKMIKMYLGSCSDRSDDQTGALPHAREAHVHLLPLLVLYSSQWPWSVCVLFYLVQLCWLYSWAQTLHLLKL